MAVVGMTLVAAKVDLPLATWFRDKMHFFGGSADEQNAVDVEV